MSLFVATMRCPGDLDFVFAAQSRDQVRSEAAKYRKGRCVRVTEVVEFAGREDATIKQRFTL